jgi:hypothetical protein
MSLKKGQVHKLEDLEVQEVSIVDVPANKRRFLTVKSEVGMPEKGAEIVTDDQGNFVTAGSTPQILAGPTSVLPVEKAEVDLAEIFAATGQNFAILEKRLSIDPDIRKEVFREVGDAMGRLNSVLMSADFAENDWKGDNDSTLVPVLADELAEVAKVIAGVGKRLGKSIKKAATPEEDEFQEALGTISTQLDSIEKAGAKMSKGRLSQFVKAIDILGSILTELQGVKAEKAAEAAPKAPEAVAPTDAVEKMFAGLTAQITGLTATVRKNAGRIHSMERTPATSNAIPVEKTGADPVVSDETSWPLDMNDEKTRDTVDKSISFLEG